MTRSDYQLNNQDLNNILLLIKCITSFIGGWLLMEPWITPTIFEEVNIGDLENKIVDEYTYAQYVDKKFAKERLNRF